MAIDIEWQDSANCLGTDDELFFPSEEEGKKGMTTGVRKAKQVCAGCEVRQKCLERALTLRPYPIGVWGGTTTKEREKMRGRKP